MSETIIVSICSKQKDQRKALLPARERYLGSHINIAAEEAEHMKMQFFILSGKYGLLAANELVSLYDHQLSERAVPELAARLVTQLGQFVFKIERVRFFTKNKPAWLPYGRALKEALRAYRIPLTTIELPDDA